MSSWPALFAAAVAMWLILKGPAGKKPSWVQKTCRLAMAFFLYSGFLYLLKWNPFWRWMPSVDFETRNKAEGFLILISTLVLDHCDTANLPSEVPGFPACTFRWA